MDRIQEVLEQNDWRLNIEVDLNVGGDGTRVRLSGDTQAFRNLAEILTTMADTVENRPVDPSGANGWFLMFGSEDMPQFQFENATFLSLDCERTVAD
jgi:hypothetical protein